ncbi:MAG: hypothetical protein AAFR23_00635 [Pseudomonadota bacterium]
MDRATRRDLPRPASQLNPNAAARGEQRLVKNITQLIALVVVKKPGNFCSLTAHGQSEMLAAAPIGCSNQARPGWLERFVARPANAIELSDTDAIAINMNEFAAASIGVVPAKCQIYQQSIKAEEERDRPCAQLIKHDPGRSTDECHGGHH